MDNRINKLRHKISVLRMEMLETEGVMRRQVAQDQNCVDAATRLLTMRAELVRMIVERKALGDLMPIGQPDLRKSRIPAKLAMPASISCPTNMRNHPRFVC